MVLLRLVETEQIAEDPGLSMQVLFGNPQHLPFANHLYRFDPGKNRAGRR